MATFALSFDTACPDKRSDRFYLPYIPRRRQSY
jgi:hypothetical protein